MPWIAAKPHKITRDGKAVQVEVGDEVPEAEFLSNRAMWVRKGYYRWLERASAPVKVKKVKPIAAKIETQPEEEEELKPSVTKKKKAKKKIK